MLSANFTAWVATLDTTDRVLTPAEPVKRMSLTARMVAAGYTIAPARRNESLKEFFANRSSK